MVHRILRLNVILTDITSPGNDGINDVFQVIVLLHTHIVVIRRLTADSLQLFKVSLVDTYNVRSYI